MKVQGEVWPRRWGRTLPSRGQHVAVPGARGPQEGPQGGPEPRDGCGVPSVQTRPPLLKCKFFHVPMAERSPVPGPWGLKSPTNSLQGGCSEELLEKLAAARGLPRCDSVTTLGGAITVPTLWVRKSRLREGVVAT